MVIPRCTVSRCAAAWAESLEGAIRGHRSRAMLCRCRCRLLLAEVPTGSDGNAEMKLRLQLSGENRELIGRVLEQQHSGPLRRRKRVTQPQTDEQRGKRGCALKVLGSTSKAMKGLVGGAAQGSADCRMNWTTALIPRSSGSGTHTTSAEFSEAAPVARGGGRYKAARSAMREQGLSRTGIASCHMSNWRP